MLGPVVTFGIAILAQNFHAGATLSIATVFTSLAIIDLMAGPLAQLLSAVPSLSASMGSFERIQTFVRKARSSTEPLRPEPQVAFDNRPDQDDAAIELQDLSSNKAFGQREVAFVENGAFSAKVGDEPILRDINLRILPSTLTMIIGRVGSGKTVLLKGLLGELPATGSVRTLQGGVAYCAQTTWLSTATVKENISGQASLDQDWYDRVVHACALVPDFAQLADGDDTVVGSKGQSLSGGQKQRVVSLCRPSSQHEDGHITDISRP